jgi:hypothetical protein
VDRPALRWMRVPGDTVFAVGIAAIVLFILGLGRGRVLGTSASSHPSSADQEAAPAE